MTDEERQRAQDEADRKLGQAVRMQLQLDDANRDLGRLVRRMKPGTSLQSPSKGCQWYVHTWRGVGLWADEPEKVLESAEKQEQQEVSP